MKTKNRSMIILAGLLPLVFCILMACSADEKLKVTNLRCEYLENPLGMDVPVPRFSWNIRPNKIIFTIACFTNGGSFHISFDKKPSIFA